MSDIQTGENYSCDSRIFVGFGIDWVSQKWQNAANVPGMFAKTAAFPSKHLAATVKTDLAPDLRQQTEGLTTLPWRAKMAVTAYSAPRILSPCFSVSNQRRVGPFHDLSCSYTPSAGQECRNEIGGAAA